MQNFTNDCLSKQTRQTFQKPPNVYQDTYAKNRHASQKAKKAKKAKGHRHCAQHALSY